MNLKRILGNIMLFLMGIAVLLTGYQLLTKQSPSVNVATVIDGDTFILQSGERIRLLGVNAPEIDRCFGKEAKIRLEELVLYKNITIEESTYDSYNRRMGLVYVGNELVNTKMIEEGFGKPDYTKNSQSALFIEAYNNAKKRSLGVNSSQCKQISEITQPDPQCVIKGNIDKATGDRFYHVPTCPHYDQIVLDLDTDEGYFCSEKEAQEAGFIIANDCLRKK